MQLLESGRETVYLSMRGVRETAELVGCLAVQDLNLSLEDKLASEDRGGGALL